MKKFLVIPLLLFSVSLFAQSTIDFETVGLDYNWVVFANGTGDSTDFEILANPNSSGINTSATVAKFKVNTNAEVFAGVWSDSLTYVVTADNAYPTIMVHKDVISDCAFKLEGPGLNHEVKVPNTVTGAWEKLTFDFSADIGKTVTRIVFFPDFPATRTAGSLTYFDNIQFVEPKLQTIDWETVGNDWTWNPFALGSGSYNVVPNPSVGGLNTSENVGQLIVGADGDPWGGMWTDDIGSWVIDSSNCIIKVLAYKDVISRFNLKLEPPNVDHFTPNTVINQWEELTFDYTSDIGTTFSRLTIIPDQEDGFPRSYASTNHFDFITFNPITPIPVEMTSFTAAVVSNTVELKWQTATETNNRGFEIYKSVSGSPFSKIGFVAGNGTTTEAKSYSFVDRDVRAGENYGYRIKQIDFDGTFEYSKVVNVNGITPTEFSLDQNYPNPFNPSTNISYSVPVKSEVTLEVYNLIGQKIMTLVQGSVEAGKHFVQMNGSSMASGIYLLKINAVGENGSQFTSSKKMTLMK